MVFQDVVSVRKKGFRTFFILFLKVMAAAATTTTSNCALARFKIGIYDSGDFKIDDISFCLLCWWYEGCVFIKHDRSGGGGGGCVGCEGDDWSFFFRIGSQINLFFT